MVWYFTSEDTEIFENKLALKARLDAENLYKSEISFEEDFVDVKFNDNPFKGYLLHAKLKSNGSISGYVHHFNPVFIILLILILVIILISDWSGAFKEDLENSLINRFTFWFLFS
ncbi:hypothetical protein [Ekhidna sp.]|uniref:hypothetical protein n=1 Tax=Ekhidna sp. TaxID=2608089 RepID=UPI003C7BA03C